MPCIESSQLLAPGAQGHPSPLALQLHARFAALARGVYVISVQSLLL